MIAATTEVFSSVLNVDKSPTVVPTFTTTSLIATTKEVWSVVDNDDKSPIKEAFKSVFASTSLIATTKEVWSVVVNEVKSPTEIVSAFNLTISVSFAIGYIPLYFP